MYDILCIRTVYNVYSQAAFKYHVLFTGLVPERVVYRKQLLLYLKGMYTTLFVQTQKGVNTVLKYMG